ncbi:MAG: hypothetical protein A2X36_15460 [Elusimicrobia bacterium GWA2_69_24]|nr:MAG: hypothetical protein A2X36_15460 [Elusimicrobia bacterium GWA2_69_24]HBL18113.1 DUF808 domain-containing protein [Elusimicrobiota bacterium]
MAGGSLLALLDDIATVLDDVALLTKVAAQKTAGVLGDDLALNAQQVEGVRAERELPVVWAVAKGSLVNKAILVPSALAISALTPRLVTPLLMLGGAYLCYEGFEKVFHRLAGGSGADEARRAEVLAALTDPGCDLVALEAAKIRGAVRTDFILSAEIIVISLGTVAASPLSVRVPVLVAIAVLMTAGVYGLVAGIVKLDDIGLWLSQRGGVGSAARLQRRLGAALLAAAPRMMQGISGAGVAAMFLVGGGILAHGIAPLHHAIAGLAGGWGAAGRWLVPLLANTAAGVAAGAAVFAAAAVTRRSRRSRGT